MRVLFADTLLGNLNFQPLGVLSLAAVCRAAGHEVRLADLTDPRRVERTMREFMPEVVGFPVVTGQHQRVLRLTRRLKSRFDFHAVFGGPHATFFPQLALRPEVDAVCRGEGERSLVEHLRRYEQNDEPQTTPGFAFGDGDRLRTNPPATLIENLDELPFAALESLDDHPLARRFPVQPFMAARGCPYHCSFCYNDRQHEMYRAQGRWVRRFSPERFVAEILAYKRRAPLSFVYIFDDTFATDRAWLEAFAVAYKREIGLPFFVNFLAGLVTRERIALLKDAGLAYVGVGLEVGDERRRREVLCKNVTDAQLRHAAAVLHAAHVPFEFYSMLALPGATFADDLQTLALNVELQPTVPDVMIFQPYPGTALGDEAMRLNLFTGDPDDLPSSFKDRSVLAIPDRRRVRRLYQLFRVLVTLRASKRTADRLSRLPLYPLYWLIGRFFEGLVKSRGIYRIRVSARDFLTLTWRYLRG